MRIIKRSTIAGYRRAHPEAEKSLKQWMEVTRAARWGSIQAVRKTFPHADAVLVASGNTVTIFNIGGNDFRLVVSIKYKWGMVYIRDFLTHAQYSKECMEEEALK